VDSKRTEYGKTEKRSNLRGEERTNLIRVFFETFGLEAEKSALKSKEKKRRWGLQNRGKTMD